MHLYLFSGTEHLTKDPWARLISGSEFSLTFGEVSQSTHTISWEWDTNPTMLICSQWSDMGSHMWDMWQCMAPPTGCTTSFPLIQREIPAGQHNLQQKYDTDIIYVFLNGRTLIPDIRPWTEIPPYKKSPNVETNIVVYIHKKNIFSINIRLSRNTFKGIVRIKTFINTDFIRYNFILIFVHSLTSIIKIVRHWRHCKSNPNVPCVFINVNTSFNDLFEVIGRPGVHLLLYYVLML